MNKCFLLTFILAVSAHVYSQDSPDSDLAYSQVVKVDSTLQGNELYRRAKTWIAETYRNAQHEIKLDDKENGRIISKGVIRYISRIIPASEATKGWITYTLSIQVKNGRYKYEINNFNHEGNPLNSGGPFSFGLITKAVECPYKGGFSQDWRNKVWNDIKDRIEKNIRPLTESLVVAMKEPVSKGSEW